MMRGYNSICLSIKLTYLTYLYDALIKYVKNLKLKKIVNLRIISNYGIIKNSTSRAVPQKMCSHQILTGFEMFEKIISSLEIGVFRGLFR